MIKLGDVVMILDFHRQGLSVSAIARQLECDRKTVRKYIERGLKAPAYGPRQPPAGVTTTSGIDENAIGRDLNVRDLQSHGRQRSKSGIHHGKHPPMLCLPNLEHSRIGWNR